MTDRAVEVPLRGEEQHRSDGVRSRIDGQLHGDLAARRGDHQRGAELQQQKIKWNKLIKAVHSNIMTSFGALSDKNITRNQKHRPKYFYTIRCASC